MSGVPTSIHGRRLQITTQGDLIHRSVRDKSVYGLSITKTLTAAQVLALNGTPIEIVPAPALDTLGTAIVVRRWMARHAAGTAYAGIAAGEDLVLKYTNASGAQAAAAIETDGFLTLTTAAIRVAPGYIGGVTTTPADVTPVANAALVAQLLVGEITTGNMPLIIKVEYDLLDVLFE